VPTLRIDPRIAVLLVAAALVATELGLRSTGHYTDDARFEPSQRYGHRLIAGEKRISPRGAPVSINSLGFRDREWSADVDEVTRVAVLGDSVSFGQDVAEPEVWCRLLETNLRARDAASGTDRDIVVQNYSVPGYCLEHSARVFDDLVAPTRPAVVVLTIAPYSIRPLKERHDPALSEVRRWLLRSAIVQSVNRAVGRADRVMPIAQLRAEIVPIGDPFAPQNDALWELAFARIDGMRRAVESWGGHLTLMSTPALDALFDVSTSSRFEVWARAHPGVVWVDPMPALSTEMAPLLAEMRERQLTRGDVWKLYAPDDVRPEHLESAAFFIDDSLHMNERGHRAVAEMVESALRAGGVL
jgi:lysophospholipase L1-like esterase